MFKKRTVTDGACMELKDPNFEGIVTGILAREFKKKTQVDANFFKTFVFVELLFVVCLTCSFSQTYQHAGWDVDPDTPWLHAIAIKGRQIMCVGCEKMSVDYLHQDAKGKPKKYGYML